jgi:choline/glycine/proline betaine transport protein
VVLIMTFFVTSSDSGSLVIDALASGGASRTPVWQRVFWAALQGVLASALLVGGGLSALQTMSIASALPFAVIMLLAAVGMWRALVIEGHRELSLRDSVHGGHRSVRPGGWRKRLAGLIEFPSRGEVEGFIAARGLEAMRIVGNELRDRGWPAEVRLDEANQRAYIEVLRPGQVDFIYELRLRGHTRPAFAAGDAGELYYRAEVFLRRGGLEYDLYGSEVQEIIDDIVCHFEKYLHFLHISPGILPWKMDEHDDMIDTEGAATPPEAQKS